jgi:hypothetical protein
MPRVNKKLVIRIAGKGFPELLERPFRRGMLGDIAVTKRLDPISRATNT